MTMIENTKSFLQCMVCGNGEFSRMYFVNDTNEGVEGQWSIISCRYCGLGVLEPFPSQNEIAGFYVDQFYTKEGKRFRNWVEVLRRWLAHLRARTINSLCPQRGRLLDFGAGAGHFAEVQRKAGWEVFAVDPYSAAGPDNNRARLEDDRVVLDFPDGYFDAVTLWYVIEHLRNPVEAISEFHRVLRPGGILLLAQQDFGSLQARAFGPCWLFLDPPRHLWQFNENNLRRLVTDLGFEPEVVTRASIEVGPFTILQSTLNKILGNQNYLFRYLKNARLPAPGSSLKPVTPFMVSLSLLLFAALSPFALISYFIFLALGSGDIFVLYSRKKYGRKQKR